MGRKYLKQTAITYRNKNASSRKHCSFIIQHYALNEYEYVYHYVMSQIQELSNQELSNQLHTVIRWHAMRVVVWLTELL